MRSQSKSALAGAWLLGLGLTLLAGESLSEPSSEGRVEPPAEEESSDKHPPEEAPSASESDLGSVSIDDFDVPDEVSFEPLWDATWDPNLTFTSPQCSLDLAGGARSEAVGESFYLYAVLSVPLRGCRPPETRIAPPVPRLSAQSARLVSYNSTNERNGEVVLDMAEGTENEPGSGRGAERAVQQGRKKELLFPPLPKGFLAEFRSRVLEARGLSRSEERIDSLIRREKASGILPELRLRGVHGFDQSLALASVGVLPGQSTTRGTSDLLAEVRLTFRLQRFLVGDSEVSLERSRQALLEKAQDSLEDALDQLLLFRKASVLAEAPDRTPEEELDATLLAEGARIRLHVLTGGWFPLEGPLPDVKPSAGN